MWPFGSGAIEAARKIAEERAEKEKKEDYEIPPYIVPPEVPAVTEEDDDVGVVGSVYGVPVSDVHALRQLSLTTGIPTSDLISVLEGAIDTIPSTILKGMREL